MSTISAFIESGILEMYVLGHTSPEENATVEQMVAMSDQVRDEIEEISNALEKYAQAHAVEPDPMVRPFLMATIDYTERLKSGEAPSFPPMLHDGSRITDYDEWLSRADLQLNEHLTDVHAKIIGFTPEATTAIVWLRDGSPPETHTHELEKFLIVEGTCNITIGDDTHSLKPGDTLIIPLFIRHHVKVTSDHPCKIILQRVAA